MAVSSRIGAIHPQRKEKILDISGILKPGPLECKPDRSNLADTQCFLSIPL